MWLGVLGFLALRLRFFRAVGASIFCRREYFLSFSLSFFLVGWDGEGIGEADWDWVADWTNDFWCSL